MTGTLLSALRPAAFRPFATAILGDVGSGTGKDHGAMSVFITSGIAPKSRRALVSIPYYPTDTTFSRPGKVQKETVASTALRTRMQIACKAL